MLSLGWKDFFKVLVPTGLLGYLLVAISGNIWVGVPALMGLAWLFHDFRKKVTTFKRIFKEELSVRVQNILAAEKSRAKGLKKDLWDENQTKVYSFIITPIILILLWMLLISLLDPGRFDPGRLASFTDRIVTMISFSVITFLCWSVLLILMSSAEPGGYKMTDERMGEIVIQLLKLIFWQIPKFFLKVTILTIRAVHSRESVAMAIYGLSGMLYIIIFPPFQLAPAIQFLLGIGCGIFTGCCGLVIHKVLSIVSVQAIFAKVEVWQW